MLKKYSSLAIGFLGLLAVVQTESCNKLNPPEVIPCYGHIDSIGLTTQYTLQGSASSNITCAWVYVDDQPVGAFEMPCTFPMIAATGSHIISIYPGITANGSSSTREKYPFYTYFEQPVNITQGSVTKFSFTANYSSYARFAWLEDFENPSFTISNYTYHNDTTMFKVSGTDVFQGSSSGEVILDSNSSVVHYSYTGVSDSMTLPHNGTSVFLEMNYNTNNTFGVGIFTQATNITSAVQQAVAVWIFPSTGWKKMYVDLTSALANQTGPFMIYFTMQRTVGNARAKLILDNIKVVTFK